MGALPIRQFLGGAVACVVGRANGLAGCGMGRAGSGHAGTRGALAGAELLGAQGRARGLQTL